MKVQISVKLIKNYFNNSYTLTMLNEYLMYNIEPTHKTGQSGAYPLRYGRFLRRTQWKGISFYQVCRSFQQLFSVAFHVSFFPPVFIVPTDNNPNILISEDLLLISLQKDFESLRNLTVSDHFLNSCNLLVRLMYGEIGYWSLFCLMRFFLFPRGDFQVFVSILGCFLRPIFCNNDFLYYY